MPRDLLSYAFFLQIHHGRIGFFADLGEGQVRNLKRFWRRKDNKNVYNIIIIISRAECYELWVDNVKSSLEAKGDDRLDFSELKEMLEEAQTSKYPETELFEALTLTVEEAEKCQTVAHQLGNKKVSIIFFLRTDFFCSSYNFWRIKKNCLELVNCVSHSGQKKMKNSV